ncbi:MAG: response regulator transcription factor [Burkholderiaceae bacterium]
MNAQDSSAGASPDDAAGAPVARRSVVICDDHPLFRMGLATALAADATLRLVGEASTAAECIERLVEHRPDVLLLDLALPDRDGYSVLEWVRTNRPRTQVIVLSMYAEWAFAERARTLGARAYIAKEDALGEIEAALGTAAGGFYTSESVIAPADDEDGHFIVGLSERSGRLSPTELDIMRLLSHGLTSREIADRLGVSPRTVQTHRNNIAEKLGVRGEPADGAGDPQPRALFACGRLSPISVEGAFDAAPMQRR